ncbi:unnamed protein product [Cercopithifilaria johnstoni]|uniref:Uncharacterized protein n=1 Tax=Cercopithifilaria johnstoni TaxID=2874296 RepID=A0A8J2MIJ9_9BILA|nr:unnamed protein product [Cercopithifilaria johnstoni]
MSELPKKPEPKKYAKSSEDPFSIEKPIISTTKTSDNALSGKSEISEKSSKDSFETKSHRLTETTQSSRTRVISLESANDKKYEFDVDLLYSWDQSSGTISYEAWSKSLIDTFNDAKMLPQYKDIIYHAKLNQRLLRDSTPSQKLLTAKSLAMLNEAMRRDRMQGHLFKRIVIPHKKDGNPERYEFISKMCDDVISEYMASANRDNKLLEINLECGGNMPPRIKINGIRAERLLKYDDGDEECYNINQTAQMHNAKHLFQHRSTCSPALPYPSANAFGRCSIENYVKMLKERRKKKEQQ